MDKEGVLYTHHQAHLLKYYTEEGNVQRSIWTEKKE